MKSEDSTAEGVDHEVIGSSSGSLLGSKRAPCDRCAPVSGSRVTPNEWGKCWSALRRLFILPSLGADAISFSWKVLFFGQVLSFLIASSGVAAEYASEAGENFPTFMVGIAYVLLALVYGGYYYSRQCTTQKRDTLNVAWWKYALIALVDMEANYFVTLAYQYTNITSVMLLDCFTIPTVMILSRIFLGRHYTRKSVAGVAVCVAGLCFVVISDVITGNNQTSAPEPLRGDLLCLAGSVLYAISNVFQESIVKTHDYVEYLGMLGIFGSLWSSLQVALIERKALVSVTWSSDLLSPVLCFALVMFALYSSTPIFLRHYDATLLNISMLSSDVFAVIAGFILFREVLSALYFVAFFIVVCGVLIYHGANGGQEGHECRAEHDGLPFMQNGDAE